MRVSVLQMNPGHDKAANIAAASGLIDAAVSADRPDLLGLPEVWTCLGGDRAAKFEQAETLPPPGSNQPGGAAYEFLRSVAREKRIHVHGGSIGEKAGERLFNTTVLFDRTGREIARYRKIHLFDIVTPDGTGYRESATFASGDEVVTADVNGVTVGLAICYDLRFPELFLALRRAGAELIFLPAAFTRETGRDHWEVLLRARAIETQCWIAAPACYGRHADAAGAPRWTYGHSALVDPWGAIVASASDGTGWTTATIDRALTERVRRDMPMLAHRKLA
ncbi:MAG: carbon-nitrogen hydrolase family protein [Acetobacteraceae bacterium]